MYILEILFRGWAFKTGVCWRLNNHIFPLFLCISAILGPRIYMYIHCSKCLKEHNMFCTKSHVNEPTFWHIPRLSYKRWTGLSFNWFSEPVISPGFIIGLEISSRMVHIDKTVRISSHKSPWNILCQDEILLKETFSFQKQILWGKINYEHYMSTASILFFNLHFMSHKSLVNVTLIIKFQRFYTVLEKVLIFKKIKNTKFELWAAIVDCRTSEIQTFIWSNAWYTFLAKQTKILSHC